MEASLAEAKKDLESNDAARMKSAMEKLTALGGELYAAAQKANEAAGAGAGAAPGPDASAQSENPGQKAEKKADVVDADFEVVDDDKNKK
jgi:molecular chaperone DnaK